MGCGPSHFGFSYSRKTKKKKTKHKESDDEKSEDNIYENYVEEQNVQLTSTPSANNLCDMSDMNDSSPLHHLVSGSSSSTSLFINSQLSTSQLNFFKVLDEKIEMGADYKQTIEEQRLEKIHRTHTFLIEWERARILNSPKPYSNSKSFSMHKPQQLQFHISHSVVQFDQDQGVFCTELI